MQTQAFIQSRVARYYWRDDINCATTTLKILSEYFDVPLADQVIDGAIGMHGAGEYGAQCGLVEGALMFMGIIGRSRIIPDETIVAACQDFAAAFENRFNSLSCAVLRPEGFDPENPPHLCEAFTCEAVAFTLDFVQGFLGAEGAMRAGCFPLGHHDRPSGGRTGR